MPEVLCCLLELRCQLVLAIHLILKRALSQLNLTGLAPAGCPQHTTLCLCQLATGTPALHSESCLPCPMDHMSGNPCQLSHLQGTADKIGACEGWLFPDIIITEHRLHADEQMQQLVYKETCIPAKHSQCTTCAQCMPLASRALG